MPQENCFNVGDEDFQVPAGKATPRLSAHQGWHLPSSQEPTATGRPSSLGFWLYRLPWEIWALEMEAARALPLSEPQVEPGLRAHGPWELPDMTTELRYYANTTHF